MAENTERMYSGKCGGSIRVKTWRTGYSLKCMRGKRTLLINPFDEEMLQEDMLVFCDNCKQQTEAKR